MPCKKALTGQARQQLYIAKLKSDPAAYEEYKERERDRWNRRKESIKPKSNRDIRQRRKKWRESQKRSRPRQKKMNELRSIDETPPATPVAGPLVMPLGMDQQNATNSSDSRKLSGRKKVRRNRSAAYKEIQRLKVALAKAQRRSQKYKKQAQRAKAGVSSSIKDTPRSKTRSMLSQSIVNPVVKSLFSFTTCCVTQYGKDITRRSLTK